jgi:RNA polymerase subunit RPABC4/transcription elongation factor Spt4
MSTEGDSLSERAKQAEKITQNPSRYKVCSGCDSIVVATAASCPSCHAYRFITDGEIVKTTARNLAKRERKSVLTSDLE